MIQLLRCMFTGCIWEPTPDHHQLICQRCEGKYVPEHWNERRAD